MRLLAIDTALPAVSVCVFDSSDSKPLASESAAMTRGHAEALMPMVERVTAAAPGGFAALDRIAVTIGPGSFTGIRVGLAAARGLALALGKPAVGVSTLAALAAPHILARDPRRILSVVDARHGHCYAQAFSGAGQSLGPPIVASHAEALALAGPGRIRAVGDGAAGLADAAMAGGVEMEIVGDPVGIPPIRFVAMLGLLAEPGDGKPRPLYIKPVDAKPMAAASAVA